MEIWFQVFGKLFVTRQILSRRLSRFAEAVEQEIEENAEEGVDQASDEKTHGEPRLRLGEEQFLDENDDALMQHEESSGEGEACCRVLGIEARADG